MFGSAKRYGVLGWRPGSASGSWPREPTPARAEISRIEAGKLGSLSIIDAALVANAVGLDLSVKTYPGGGRPRDAAHAARLQRLLAEVRPPLRCRTEVPLPRRTDLPEQRAWDATIDGAGETTAIELEMRLHDIQDQVRRLNLKRRDGAPDRLLLVVADTRANRRVLCEYPEIFVELPRLQTSHVLRELRSGRHPPTGLVLI